MVLECYLGNVDFLSCSLVGRKVATSVRINEMIDDELIAATTTTMTDNTSSINCENVDGRGGSGLDCTETEKQSSSSFTNELKLLSIQYLLARCGNLMIKIVHLFHVHSMSFSALKYSQFERQRAHFRIV